MLNALEEAKKADVAILEAFMLDRNDWVGGLVYVMERLVVNNSARKFTELSGAL